MNPVWSPDGRKLAFVSNRGDRFDEAERVASEMLRLFPGAVDSAGAPLDSLLDGIRRLRPPK